MAPTPLRPTPRAAGVEPDPGRGRDQCRAGPVCRGRRVPRAGAGGEARPGEVPPRVPGGARRPGQLPDGEYQQDHEPFKDWYATPIHKVSGPARLAELRGQGRAGPGAGRGRRLGQLLSRRPARCFTFRRWTRTSTSCSGCGAWCSCSRARSAAASAATRTATSAPPASGPIPLAMQRPPQPAPAAAVGRRAVLLREGGAAGLGRQVRALPRREGQGPDQPDRHAGCGRRAGLLPHADRAGLGALLRLGLWRSVITRPSR